MNDKNKLLQSHLVLLECAVLINDAFVWTYRGAFGWEN